MKKENPQFVYKDYDETGVSVLDVISRADKFNRWMYETIAPYCNGKILEIGSGIGNISQFFIRDGKQVFLSDIRRNYRDFIKKKFNLDDERVIDIDIAHVDFQNRYSDLTGTFDSVFCLNVVEHIQDDGLSVANMMRLLKPGGKLTVLVPAYSCLYNGFDKTLGHYRRYSRKTLLKLMSQHGIPAEAFYFNSVGILGWFVSGKIFRNKTIRKDEMKLYNYLVPLIKLADKILFRKIGLSVVCVIQKT